jgi:methylamine--corrinoid protein Co-methyltransferase
LGDKAWLEMAEDFLTILDRTRNGPFCEVRDWETKVLPSEIKSVLKEHGLEKTCDAENPINTDDGLADDFWRAGFDLALRLGMLCPQTGRIIKFSDDELKDSLENRPSELTLGWGADQITIRSRKPEDRAPPKITGSALGMEMSDDLYIPICQSIAQYHVIDMLVGGVFRKILGRPCLARTPYETLGGKYEALLVREVLRRAGRPGMPCWGVEFAASEYGNFGGYGPPGCFDPAWAIGAALLPSPFKADYAILHKTAHGINWGAPMEAGHWTMIGGYEGSPEGAAVGAVAASILLCAVMLPAVVQSDILDMRYLSNCSREGLWANSVRAQARSRNSHVLYFGVTSQVSGPCTDNLLYETATISIVDSVSGNAHEMGTRPTGCKYPDYGSGLENKFYGEVVKSSVTLKRSDANEIVKALLPKYEDKLRYPPKGKSFIECFDLKTLKPTQEWGNIYDRVWEELEDLGLKKLSLD